MHLHSRRFSRAPGGSGQLKLLFPISHQLSWPTICLLSSEVCMSPGESRLAKISKTRIKTIEFAVLVRSRAVVFNLWATGAFCGMPQSYLENWIFCRSPCSSQWRQESKQRNTHKHEIIGTDSFFSLQTIHFIGCAVEPVNPNWSAPFEWYESLRNWWPRRDWLVSAGIDDVGRPFLLHRPRLF